jgi:hypothetical protein
VPNERTLRLTGKQDSLLCLGPGSEWRRDSFFFSGKRRDSLLGALLSPRPVSTCGKERFFFLALL